VRHFWFNNNQFHQRANSLFQMGLIPVVAVHDVEIRGNQAYSEVGWHLEPPRCFYCPSDTPTDWVIMNPTVAPYMPPPP
jgi:hypothetical protein